MPHEVKRIKETTLDFILLVEVMALAKRFPIMPKFPERICWGCDKYCPADDLACGNGSGRTQHPVEIYGEEWWKEWGIELDDPGTKSFDPSEYAPSPDKKH